MNLIRVLMSVGSFCAFSTTAFAMDAPVLNLESSFKSAMARSETIGIQTELINQAEERYRSTVGSVLPSISLVGSYLWQEAPQGSAAIFPSKQPLAKFNLAQPLFRGFREFATLRQNGKLVTAQTEDALQARVSLYSDVAQSFYTILNLEKTLLNYQTQVELYEKRIQDLKQRIRIGRSRESEVLTVQASLAAVLAQMESTRGQVKVAREAFNFLTGQPQDSVLSDDLNLVQPLPTLEYYLHRVEDRPDIKAASVRLDATEENIAIARGARLPSVDLAANYYMKRYGTTENVTWDVQLLASVPLYAGGTIDSQVRTAASQVRQSELSLSRARRQADQDIRSTYKLYVADQEQIEALRKQKAAADLNFRTQNSDYRLGLVTNLDVLQAMIQSQESQRALDTAVFSAKLDYARLENASAKNPLVEQNPPKPTQN